MLASLFPQALEPIEEAYAAALAALTDGRARTDGIALGEAAAAACPRSRGLILPSW